MSDVDERSHMYLLSYCFVLRSGALATRSKISVSSLVGIVLMPTSECICIP